MRTSSEQQDKRVSGEIRVVGNIWDFEAENFDSWRENCSAWSKIHSLIEKSPDIILIEKYDEVKMKRTRKGGLIIIQL